MTLKIPHTNLLFLFLTTTFLATTATTASNTCDAHLTSDNSESCGNNNLIPERRETYDKGRIIDISHRITSTMPSFGTDKGLGEYLWLVVSQKNGSMSNNSEFKLPTHTGTHVDSPAHFYDDYLDAGFDVDTLDLDVLNGPVLLVDVPRNSNITEDVMKSLHIPKGVRRVLFRSLNTDRRLMFKKEFDSSYVGFMKDGAQWLIDNTDIKLVGVDYLSAAAFDHLEAAHLVFLKSRKLLGSVMPLMSGGHFPTRHDLISISLNPDPQVGEKVRFHVTVTGVTSSPYKVEIILVEGLKLDNVPAGMYNVHCLPLRLIGAEGSPIRCILVK